MTLLKVNPEQRKALAVATVLAILVGIWFLKYYLILIIFAAIVALLFNPLHQKLINKGRSPGQAAMITFFASLLTIIVPVIVVGFITVIQIESLASDVSQGNYSVNVTDIGNSIINSVNDMLANIGSSYRLSTESVAQAISSAAEEFSKKIVSGLLSSITGIFAFITTAIIYIYVFMSMLTHQKKIIATVKKLNPLGEEVSELYIQRIDAMTKATVKGQFIIAVCQGVESAFVLSIAGLSDLFFFFAMILTVLSVIPLGAGIVTIPIGIIMILTGNVWQGVLVIANHLLIVTNIDNVLRPRLVPKSARLDSALMILAVFSGLAFFGFIGIVIGPVIMIVLQTTIQMFMEVFHETESLDRTKNIKSKSIYKRLKSKFS
jgi:predicted PurR-regulated permease PerM